MSPENAKMFETQSIALPDAADWLGDWHPLAEQLGSADGLLDLAAISDHLKIGPVRDAAALSEFLRQYHELLMFPLELPAIYGAYGHACRQELRELVILDQTLSDCEALAALAGASQRVGAGQLQKLRPLRDVRLVQRYLRAVEEGQAHGWHTLVYGITMAVYSLPLRQGLLGYAWQVTRGFI